MSGKADSTKSVIYALAANFAIAIAKSAGAWFTGSSSMLAEAVHSFADCGNQGMLLWGMKEARHAPTADIPLGHGRATYFWSFIVALMLFSMGGLFSVYEGWHKLSAGEPMEYAWVAAAILVFGIAAESVSLWGCLREIDKVRDGRSLWRWFRDSRESELIVILGEDLAALGGLVLALGFIGLAAVTGNPVWDAVGSIAIGLLLILVAIAVGVEVKSLLTGQSADPRQVAAMSAFLATQPEVERVFNLLTQQMGSDVMVAVKARLRPLGSETALLEAINRIEKDFRAAFPQTRWMFFEPDLAD